MSTQSLIPIFSQSAVLKHSAGTEVHSSVYFSTENWCKAVMSSKGALFFFSQSRSQCTSFPSLFVRVRVHVCTSPAPPQLLVQTPCPAPLRQAASGQAQRQHVWVHGNTEHFAVIDQSLMASQIMQSE